jgi:hypothetical protein
VLARYAAPGRTPEGQRALLAQHEQDLRDFRLTRADVELVRSSTLHVELQSQHGSPAWASLGVDRATIERCRVLEDALRATDAGVFEPIRIQARPAAFLAWRGGAAGSAADSLELIFSAMEVRLRC